MSRDNNKLSLPFLLSHQNTDADVSEITSPCYEVNANRAGQYGSSLFSRLSRGLSPTEALSPPIKSEHFDYALSTIDPEESLLERSKDKYYGQLAMTKKSEDLPLQATRRVQGSIGASLHQSYDSTYSMTFSSEQRDNDHDRSVSWDINSPTTQQQTHKQQSKQQLEATMITSSTTDYSSSSGRHSKKDEWREVTDPESGRIYYYNRLTRMTRWKLPNGAALSAKKKKKKKNATTINSRLNTTPQQLVYGLDDNSVVVAKQSAQSEDDECCNSHNDNGSHSADNASSASASIEEKSQGLVASSTNNHVMSPQDCTSTDCIFCIYCGLKCSTVSVLSSHLPNCKAFIHMHLHNQKMHQELESVLFRAWSQVGSSDVAVTIAREHTPFVRPAVDYSFNQEQEESHDNSTVSNGAQTLLFESENCKPTKTSTPSKPRRHAPINVLSVEMKKSCPFCDDNFMKGNEFSSHLLKCTERRRARKQRRTRKKDSPVVDAYAPRSRKPVTPGRKMPWE